MRMTNVGLVILVVLAGTVGASAQGFGTQRVGSRQTVPGQQNDPIILGPFLFSPGLQLGYDVQSNLFRGSGESGDVASLVSRLRLDFELPIRESVIKLSFNPQYITSNDVDVFDRWEQYLDLTGKFSFSSGLTLGLAYHYIEGKSSVGEVDPGGEIVFTGNTFRTQNFGLNLGYWFTSRDGASVAYSRRSTRWEQDPDLPESGGYDSDIAHFDLSWMHQLTPSLVMDVRYRRSENEPADPEQSVREVATDDVTVSVRGEISAYLETGIRFGYLRSDHPNAASVDPDFEEYEGFAIEGHISRVFAHDSVLRLDLLHRPYVSGSGSDLYYKGTGARLLYNWSPGRFFGQVRVGYQQNRYENGGSSPEGPRSDDLTTYGVGLGYRVSNFLSIRSSYVLQDRDSNLPQYSFENNMFSVDLILGL